jgi:GWxTD domain-containing protein
MKYFAHPRVLFPPRAIGLAFLVAFLPLPAGADERVDRLPEEHRVWLEEEVVYIITEAEREVFLGVEGFEEREHFIEAFWQRRDPVPATKENEFRVEHYKRFDYANRFLGRDAPRPGWQTDRGRHWIILGEPRQREQFDGRNEVVSLDLWIYQGDTKLGLPPRFNLLFFKEEDIGEYELYHPWADGPDALLRRGELLRNRQHAAVDLLEMVSMDLARASLVVDLTDPHADFLSATNTIAPRLDTVRPSMSVEKNFVDIAESPLKLVDLEEIEGYLRYGDRVTAEYSFRFVKSEADFRVLVGPRNTPFIHYSLKLAPEDFSLEFDDREMVYQTTLDVDLELRTLDGQLVAMQRNEPEIRLTESEHVSAGGSPFAYRDNLPVIPGEYEVSVVVRNRATQQYTVASAEVRVPATGSGTVGLADLILAYRVERGSGFSGLRFGTFQFGSAVLEPAVGGTFAASDTLSVAAQAVNAGLGHRVRLRIVPGEALGAETGASAQPLAERIVPAGKAAAPPIEDFPLAGIGAGRYRVTAELLDGAGEVVASREAPLLVSPRAAVDRPRFIVRRSFATHVPGLLALALGEQFMAYGRIAEATVAFREATANPDLPMARWKLASALLFARKADEALDLLLPIETEYPNEIEVAEGVGFAYYIRRQCGEAVPRLEHALTLRAADPSLLNALGDCHEQLGDGERARVMFERSLELHPGQQGVRDRLAGLGELR